MQEPVTEIIKNMHEFLIIDYYSIRGLNASLFSLVFSPSPLIHFFFLLFQAKINALCVLFVYLQEWHLNKISK